LLVAGVAIAADDWLSRASHAVRTTNYQGVLVYLRGGNIDTLRIVHRYRDDEERERLISLTGKPREVLRDGAIVTSILPERRVAIVAQHPRKGLLSNFGRYSTERLDAHYRFHDLGNARLAGRLCRVVLLQPKDPYRYGYRLMIDRQTHLPLKLDLLSGDKVLEQLMFTSIEFPETIPDEALDSSYDTKEYRWIRHQSIEAQGPEAGGDAWHIEDMPLGFKLAEDGLRRVGGGVARQFLFTDGIATVSAFIAPPGGGRRLIGGTTMGAVNAYGRQIDGYQITVVGEVPEITVRYIAEHLRRRAAGD
jgi:sigma-E factor negative regulatory protein RseB